MSWAIVNCFGKPLNKPLTAKKAHEMTMIAIKKRIIKRRADLLNNIKSAVDYGNLYLRFNAGEFSYWMSNDDIPYLKSLGYQIKEYTHKTEKPSQRLDRFGYPTPPIEMIYNIVEVHWDIK